MRLYAEFEHKGFGSYNALLHAEEKEATEIMEHFGYDILPDMIPAKYSMTYTNLYLFLIDTEEKIITPLWSYIYVYGPMYEDDGPVGKEMTDFDIDITEYRMEYFTKPEKDWTENNPDRNTWPDKTAPVFNRREQSK